jgi:hypothetical protein
MSFVLVLKIFEDGYTLEVEELLLSTWDKKRIHFQGQFNAIQFISDL